MSEMAEPYKHQSKLPKHNAIKLKLDNEMGWLYPKTFLVICEFLGYHIGVVEDFVILGYAV